MCAEKKENSGENPEDEGQDSSGAGLETIEVSGDSAYIGKCLHHIGDGLFAIAKSIKALADSQSVEPSENDSDKPTYLGDAT